ncbi:MAG: tetratricopeptide repeat protein, partial [Pseudanabaena sp. SU_2_4]|nr:tetratricopeptide repeat protein [Pseudanabaena sp. SU_2_4]
MRHHFLFRLVVATLVFSTLEAPILALTVEQSLWKRAESFLLAQSSAENFLNRGDSLYEQGRYQEALVYYDRAIQLKPDYAHAWNKRGNTLNELKRYQEALASFDRALQLVPNYFEAWYNRGNALDELKRFQEAIASYDK